MRKIGEEFSFKNLFKLSKRASRTRKAESDLRQIGLRCSQIITETNSGHQHSCRPSPHAHPSFHQQLSEWEIFNRLNYVKLESA